ncbi:hypothetical protein EHI8A_041700 [Entamoeba histolytica HM-1:IMSS-B]|uniref:Thioredoxin domain-containing protein n=6 Tax=Entamoeba histolytica TaxID=5759 RepID=C4M2Q3_ENTH1|nr:hypothetical protein EHI_160850 [Entamoeba histolytica HM-1:IMSS]EMD43371.1 Hypothetical protein EHI5A_072970 [Entamoeba histolytica KU27]EMH77455.1 hypothetical protein EHI8A_041700 [Entamoeba histolytica HM-1:IMSS-B]EMS17318.1 hypothetical protein KM1_085420 [Entamoeba histolytica HM-3:IMSS]ENY61184.1 hypothetical protein EHI7A_043030 [Entamoeba histolytica HM-1:IMSS-A]GAT95564.1 hypothetical protein CL6EHI_160850 [Entamoeba histolytica]|eukprot:XP_648299.2 hypothetical protein EHI_160850 [Entamoeba histolytica HM-1:IMSS]
MFYTALLFFLNLVFGKDVLITEDLFRTILDESFITVVGFHKGDNNTVNQLKELEKKLSNSVITYLDINCNENEIICTSHSIHKCPVFAIYHQFISTFYDKIDDVLINDLQNIIYGIREINSTELNKMISNNQTFVLLQYTSQEIIKDFLFLARGVRRIPFYSINDTHKSLILYNDEFTPLQLPLDLDMNILFRAINSYANPIVSSLNANIIKRNFRNRDIIVFYNNEINENDLVELKKIALENYLWLVTYVDNKNEILDLLPVKEAPAVFSYSMKTLEPTIPLKLSEEGKWSEIREYIKRCSNGSVEQFIKNSDPIDENKQGLVHEINAKQLEAYKHDYKDLILLVCDSVSEDCIKAKKELDIAANMLVKYKYTELAFIDIDKNTVKTCTSQYPMIVMYSGITERSCFSDNRPITAQVIVTLARERGIFTIRLNSFNPEIEMIDPQEALKLRKELLKERADLEKSSEFSSVLSSWKSFIKRKDNLYKAKNFIRILND